MQAIITTYMSPTNTRGGRLKAKADAGTLTIGYPHHLDVGAAHAHAAQQLIVKLGWTHDNYGTLITGSLPGDKGYAHVFTTRSGDGR